MCLLIKKEYNIFFKTYNKYHLTLELSILYKYLFYI